MIQKYSLKDFLTNEIELISKDSNYQKIKIHKIEIPMIQRDYAQGRSTVSSKKKNAESKLNSTGEKFINELFGALSNDTGLELDFVYGSISKIEDGNQVFNYFYPLDGQQRLTTLYLLYWFIGGAELEQNHKRELSDILKNFFYSTRSSSNAFCQQLVLELTKNEIDFLSRNEETLISQIENLSWFHNSYKKDPTVSAMLNMLDRIQELYINGNHSNLFSKLELLRFYILPLTNFDLTEELYVKMNARGKQLSNFENFKADLQHWIRDNTVKLSYLEKSYSGRTMPYDMVFINKMDNEWAQCFWNANKTSTDKNYDSIFLKFLYRYWCNEYVLQNHSVKTTELEKSAEYSFFTLEPEYIGFTPFGEQITSRDFLENLEFILDAISNHYDDIVQNSQPCWGNTIFQIFSPEAYKLLQRAIFGAVILYLKNLKKKNLLFDVDGFKDWMHVAWNIVENADIDHGYVYISVLCLLNEWSDYSHDIYNALANTSINIASQQSKETIAEERHKARLIVSQSDWKDILCKAESHPFFKGSISFMLPQTEMADTASINDFEHKYELAQIFFDNNGITPKYRENGHLFLRALISRYEKLTDIKYHITDTSEKENSLKSMLMSDSVVRAAIYEWLSLNDESEVNLQLEKEVQKSSPISTTENDFEYKIHESMYRGTDLINWMQTNGAIRFRDGYISRPSSSKDWIYIYGYRNEIIKELQLKGWECNNKCRLDNREIDYFWSPTVGEITLTKTVVEDNDIIQLSCSIEGKSGILNIKSIDPIDNQKFNYIDEVTHQSKLAAFVDKVDAWRPTPNNDMI